MTKPVASSNPTAKKQAATYKSKPQQQPQQQTQQQHLAAAQETEQLGAEHRATTKLSAPRELLQAAGPTFLLLGFCGRLPAACNQLGMLLIVAAAGRGLTAAGAAVAAVGLGTAAGAPLIGRAVDRFGPIRVISAALVLQALSLLGIIAALTTHASTGILLSCAALLGAANPQISSIARACWSGIARQQELPASAARLVRLGFGFETAADETSFVIGPIVAGMLVTLLGPLGAATALLASTVLFEGVFALWLSRHKNLHRSPQIPQQVSHAKPQTRVLLPALLTIFATGMVFGATQTALTAINQSVGLAALTGPMYGAMGVTSALAGLFAPALLWGWRSKLLLGGSLILLCSGVIALLPGAWLTLLFILLMGAGIGINLTTAYTAIELAAPNGRVTSVLTLGATCLVLGVSTGSLTSGALSTNLHLANTAAVLAGFLVLTAAFLRTTEQPSK